MIRNLIINLIVNDGKAFAQELVREAGINLAIFNDGSFDFATNLYIYVKSLSELDGETPIYDVYNDAIREYLREVQEDKLPTDVSPDLRAVPMLMSKVENQTFG